MPATLTTTLRYGADATIALDLPAGALVADISGPRGQPLAVPYQITAEALAAPISFPPLARATVPDDKITIALEAGVPQAQALVAATVEALIKAGAKAGDITILRTKFDAESGAVDPRGALAPDVQQQVALETHDPDDRGHVSYLAATPKGRPIYLNRHVCNADLVVPIGCLRCEQAISYHGVYGVLYPTFSDTETLERFRNPSSSDVHAEAHARKRHFVDLVGWLSGAPFVIQALPGPGDSVLDVLAGDAAEVFRVGQERCQQAWSFEIPRTAELIVASITGDAASQSWDNVGRALAAALRVVSDGGAIAICTELAVAPGPAVQGLGHADDLRSALRQIRKHRPTDALPATELAVALGRTKVYLLSRLPEDTVEELGIAAVSKPQDIVRLAQRHESCVLLNDAQFAVAQCVEN